MFNIFTQICSLRTILLLLTITENVHKYLTIQIRGSFHNLTIFAEFQLFLYERNVYFLTHGQCIQLTVFPQ